MLQFFTCLRIQEEEWTTGAVVAPHFGQVLEFFLARKL
jgi:hypothetical protein